MQDEAKPVLLCSHPSPPNGCPKLNLGVNICDSDSLAISLSLPISELSCSSCSSSSSSSLSPLGGLTPLLTNPLTLSTSPSLWSSSSSSANSNADLANHAHSPRSGPASPSNFLLPGVVNANKSPWANGSLSPQAGGGALWNRGRSAPNLTNNLLGHAPFSSFTASHSSAWSGFGSTSPAPTNRKPAPLYGNTTPTSGFLAPGQGGGRFRRSTSYPGKNNIFGAATNQIPTFEVTNIDEGNDYIYQDPYAGNLGSGGPLDNMRSLDYVLQEILPQHENDIFKVGKNYYGGLDGSPGDMGFPEDPSTLHHLSNFGGLGGMHPEGFGMSAGLNYLSSMASPSRHSPSRLSPRSPASNAGSDGGERYSRKVFVGGLPPDIDEEEINASFRRFGALVVDWPHKAESKSYFPPKGYAFLLFQEESSVQRLIEACMQEDDKLYLYVSSPTIKDKAVQIRPWKLSDADFVLDATLPLDPRKTVFVGGVPRPLKAVELALIMDRLYGGVCYAGIDIDPELKYPKGAGRVAFSNQQSYIAAISARFVQLQHGDIDKRVEVKPYVLDDQFCDECQGTRSAGRFAPFFCANITCLQYYCENCWAVVHSHPGREFHKPLVKEGADRPRTVHFRW